MTSFLTIMNPIGNIIGFLWPFVFVNPEENDLNVVKSQINQYFFWHILMTGGIFFLVFLFYKGENKNSEGKKIDQNFQGKNDGKLKKNEISFGLQAKSLMKDKCYLSLFVSGGLVAGTLGGIGAALNTVDVLFHFPAVIFIFSNFFFLDFWQC